MKIKKKHAMMLSFALGFLLLASTAFAEIKSKSGYTQLKDGLKNTAESCENTFKNYTGDVEIVIKDNGKVVYSANEVRKSDVTNGAKATVSKIIEGNETINGEYYQDKYCSISYNSDAEVYYVNKYETPVKGPDFTNPFKDEHAADIEKIIDAIVGNLKDSVVATENTDGTKEITGTLREAQIPALVNALASYGYKHEFSKSYRLERRRLTGITSIINDIFVEEITGKMVLNKDGLIQSAFGTGVLCGKDNQGVEHKLTFELLIKISDVNNTIVKKPDFTGKKVETQVLKNKKTLQNLEKYIGVYKNDIVIEKDGKFQKIGERFVEIKSINDQNVVGSYHEEFIKGYEENSLKAKKFNFNALFTDEYNSKYEAVDSSNKNIMGGLWVNRIAVEIGFYIDNNQNNDEINSGNYQRVFK